MGTADRSELVTLGSTRGQEVAVGLLVLAFVAFIASWAAIFQWLDVRGAYLGADLFTLFGLALLALAAGVAAIGVGARYGPFVSNASDSAGVTVAAVFGLLWAAIVGLLAGHLVGGGAAWLGALLGAALGGGTALYPREDLGSTLPAAGVVGLLGGVIVTGLIGADWRWDPGWTEATFPGSELVPVLVMLGALLASWPAAKAKEGYGARGRQAGAFYLVRMTVFAMLAVLALLIGFIVVNGLDVMLTGWSLTGGTLALPLIGEVPFLEVPFVTNVSGGLFVEIPGVMPATVGTLWLVVGSILFSVPLGVGAAIFLTEYAEQGRFTQLVEVATNGLWSTPSIVFGLFGLAFLVPRISGGNSIFVGQLVLSFMMLPLVLITSREAIKAVPDEYRDASVALGATKWQTIRSVVVPAAMPGVITGVIIGVGRIAGETAPLLLVFGGPPYPSSGPGVLESFAFTAQPPFVTNEALLSPASALPYQLYSSITAGVFPKEIFTTTEFGWGTALVLLIVVLGLYGIGVASRIHFRRKIHHE